MIIMLILEELCKRECRRNHRASFCSHDPKKMPIVEINSETARRKSGQELDLGSVVKGVISRALINLKISPLSCIVWRDGVGDPTIRTRSTKTCLLHFCKNLIDLISAP